LRDEPDAEEMEEAKCEEEEVENFGEQIGTASSLGKIDLASSKLESRQMLSTSHPQVDQKKIRRYQRKNPSLRQLVEHILIPTEPQLNLSKPRSSSNTPKPRSFTPSHSLEPPT